VSLDIGLRRNTYTNNITASSSPSPPTSSSARGSTTTATALAAGTCCPTATRSAIFRTSRKTLRARLRALCKVAEVEVDMRRYKIVAFARLEVVEVRLPGNNHCDRRCGFRGGGDGILSLRNAICGLWSLRSVACIHSYSICKSYAHLRWFCPNLVATNLTTSSTHQTCDRPASCLRGKYKIPSFPSLETSSLHSTLAVYFPE